jgi:hypothetical protein
MDKVRLPFFFTLLVAVSINFLACNNASDTPHGDNFPESIAFVEASNGLPTTGQWRQGISFYDMNGDGHLDILAPPPRKPAQGVKPQPFVWLGNGKGEWVSTPPQVPKNISYGYGDISAGDYNGDGIPDMALAIHSDGLKGLKGLGEGRYAVFSEGLPAPEEFNTRALTSADFNHDGITDIVAVSEGNFGKAKKKFKRGAMVCLGSVTGWKCHPIVDFNKMAGFMSDQVVTGDVNGDGNIDVGTASLQHRLDLIVWLGDGKGHFKPFNEGLPTELHYNSVAFADVNADGRDDLIASISGFGKDGIMAIKVFLSEKNGFRDMSSGLPEKELFRGVAAGDLDKDGIPEIWGGDAFGGLSVFALKDGKWRRLATPDLPGSGLERMYRTYCVDVNNDGYDDIAVNYATEKNNAGGIRVFLTVPGKTKDKTH